MYKLTFVTVILSLGLSATSSPIHIHGGVEAILAAKLPTPREDTVSYFDGKDGVYVMGGYDGLNLYDDVLLFNLSMHGGAIGPVSHFPTGITDGAVGSDSEGNFYYFGGDIGETDASSDVYKMTKDELKPKLVGKLPVAGRLQASASDGKGNVYLVGGAFGSLEERKKIVKYNTKTHKSEVVGTLETGLQGASAAYMNDYLYIFGGVTSDSVYSTSIHKFNPTTGEIQILDMQLANGGNVYASVVIVDGKIYIVGGLTPENDDNNTHHIEIFDPETETMNYLRVINWNNTHSGVSSIYHPESKRIYVFGGFTFVNNKVVRLDEITYLQL